MKFKRVGKGIIVVFRFGVGKRVSPEGTCGLLMQAVSLVAVSLLPLLATDRRQNSGTSPVILSSRTLRIFHGI